MINRPARNLYKKVAPYLLLGIASLCWAGNIVLARGVAELIPPVAFAFWRWTLAFMLILPFCLRPLAADWHEIARGWKSLLVLALLRLTMPHHPEILSDTLRVLSERIGGMGTAAGLVCGETPFFRRLTR